MVNFIEVLLSSVAVMWLKICYVLKNNKDKLLGYIHVPTKHDQFKEEIRWVPARKNVENGGGLRCVTTPELESEAMIDENNSLFEKRGILSYQDIDEMICGNDSEKSHVETLGGADYDEHITSTKSCGGNISSVEDVMEHSSVVKDDDDDDDFNMKTLSLSDDSIATNERTTNPECCEPNLPVASSNSEYQLPSLKSGIKNQNIKDNCGPKQLTVEIRYKPNSKKFVTNRRKTNKTKEGREVLTSINHESNKLSQSGDEEENQDEDKENDDEKPDITDEDSRFLELEKMSFNNKIRFIYSKGDDDSEDIFRVPSRLQEDTFRVPSRQEEFNSGIRQQSSSPKKEKSEKKTKKMKPFTCRDATFTVPCNSSELKEIIYHQWLSRKRRQAKNEAYMKSLEEKRRSREEELQSKARKLAAESEFDAWNTSKTEELLSEKVKRKKIQKQAEKEKLETSLQKAKEAEKYYAKWKKAKDENTRKAKLQQRREERERNKEQCKQRRELSEESLKAFTSWKSQKARAEAVLKKKEEEEKVKQGEEKLRQFEKRQEALRIYEQWKTRTKKKSPHSSPIANQGETADADVNDSSICEDIKQPNTTNAETKIHIDEMDKNKANATAPNVPSETPSKKIKVHVTRLHKLRASLSKIKRRGSGNSSFRKNRSLNSTLIKNRSFRSDEKRSSRQGSTKTQQQQAWNVIHCMKTSKEVEAKTKVEEQQKKDGINVFYKDILPSDQCLHSPDVGTSGTSMFNGNNVIKTINKSSKKHNVECRSKNQSKCKKAKECLMDNESRNDRTKAGHKTVTNDSLRSLPGTSITSQERAKVDPTRFVVTKQFQEILTSNEKYEDNISLKYDELENQLVFRFPDGSEEIKPLTGAINELDQTKRTEKNKTIIQKFQEPLGPKELVKRGLKTSLTMKSQTTRSKTSASTAKEKRKNKERSIDVKNNRSGSTSRDRGATSTNQNVDTRKFDVPCFDKVKDLEIESLEERSQEKAPEQSNDKDDKWKNKDEIDSAIFHSCEEPSKETEDCKKNTQVAELNNDSLDSLNEKDTEVEIDVDNTNVSKNPKHKEKPEDNNSENSNISDSIKRSEDAKDFKKSGNSMDLQDTEIPKRADDLKNKKSVENTKMSKTPNVNIYERKNIAYNHDTKRVKRFKSENDANTNKKTTIQANIRDKAKSDPKYTKKVEIKKDRIPMKDSNSNNKPNSNTLGQKKAFFDTKPRQRDEKNSIKAEIDTSENHNIRIRKNVERPKKNDKEIKQKENHAKSPDAENAEKKSNKWNQRATRLRQFLDKWRPAMDYVCVDDMRNTTDKLWKVMFYQKHEEPSCEYVATNRITGEVESSLEKKNRAWSIAFCPKKKQNVHCSSKSDNRNKKKPIVEETIQVKNIDVQQTVPQSAKTVSDKKSKSKILLPVSSSKSMASKTTCETDTSHHTSRSSSLNTADRILQIISPIFNRSGISNQYNKYSRSSTPVSSSSSPTPALSYGSNITKTHTSHTATQQVDGKNHIDPDTSFLQPTFSSKLKCRTPPPKTQILNSPKTIADETPVIKSQRTPTSRFARAMAKLKLTRIIPSKYNISVKESEKQFQYAKDKMQTQISDGVSKPNMPSENFENVNLSTCDDDAEDEDTSRIENRKRKLIMFYSAVRLLVILFLLYYVQQNMERALLSFIETCSKHLSDWSLGVSESLKLLNSKSLASLSPHVRIQYNASVINS